jgi:hypothetical protein
MAHLLPIFVNPVLRVFSKYILADKSYEELEAWRVLQAEAAVI